VWRGASVFLGAGWGCRGVGGDLVLEMYEGTASGICVICTYVVVNFSTIIVELQFFGRFKLR
jgi:hypothetical protein